MDSNLVLDPTLTQEYDPVGFRFVLLSVPRFDSSVGVRPGDVGDLPPDGEGKEEKYPNIETQIRDFRVSDLKNRRKGKVRGC